MIIMRLVHKNGKYLNSIHFQILLIDESIVLFYYTNINKYNYLSNYHVWIISGP